MVKHALTLDSSQNATFTGKATSLATMHQMAARHYYN